MSFFTQLEQRIKEKNCPICVGLDPHSAELPENTADAAYTFCTKIIDATKHNAACYKPNSAFFEALEGGIETLKKVISYIPKEIPVILDVKRGDISTTAAAYAKAAKNLGVNCVTLNGYMGYDAIKPFLDENIDAFILCKTSNPSSDEIQSIKTTNGKYVYEEVCELVKKWNIDGNHLGLVVGATDVESLKKVREIDGKVWILSPGIGAQGGNLEDSIKYGMRSEDKMGIIFNVSRGISRSKDMSGEIDKYKSNIETAMKELSIPAAPSTTPKLENYKREFIEFAIKNEVLKFGSFKLKSGRISPFFFNAGCFNSGAAMNKLCYYYYCALEDYLQKNKDMKFDVIFGPAYKGINLCCGLSMIIDQYSKGKLSSAFCYNRKEAKDGGEGGVLIGSEIKGKKVLLIDDVITAGTAIGESMTMMKDNESEAVGVIICLNRQEKGKDTDESAIAQVEKNYGIPVISVIKLADIITYLEEKGDKKEELANLMEYRSKYGAN